ncbi:acyl carrier protein [Kitasatospora sp. NPDC089509]|uniref:acyl carrier protein n=1 Tax=Kitasatospora sp. NPDC089509 TaxID=3364079 RepID=UPI00381DC93C
MTEATLPTLQQITDILVETCNVSHELIVPDALLADLELDSLALIEFGLEVERQFGFDVPTEEVSTSSNTLTDLYATVTTAFEAA